jgi:hypothetical protein
MEDLRKIIKEGDKVKITRIVNWSSHYRDNYPEWKDANCPLHRGCKFPVEGTVVKWDGEKPCNGGGVHWPIVIEIHGKPWGCSLGPGGIEMEIIGNTTLHKHHFELWTE